MFVEKAALASLIRTGGLQAARNALTRDPLPFSFPGRMP
jgi:hypothetical protein